MTRADLTLVPPPFWAVCPYRPDDLRTLALQDAQADLQSFIGVNGFAEKVAQSGEAWTAFAHGKPIACCGFQYPWEGRAIAWAVLAKSAGKHMHRLTTACRQAFVQCPADRIEATVMTGFTPGVRWVQAMGFTFEGNLTRFYKGDDYHSFVRLRNTLE